MVSGQLIPFVAGFIEEGSVEEGTEVPRSYSEDAQMGIWNEGDLLNPVYLSPTQLHTPRGDHIGDEA
ncbi:MAG: hypothetical protein G01um101433_89 [Parcubacteria group bacterium Gr01-1014_33]|nr:MAG: hypothetical protein G01um101433_89 [Parcubacteria group bacterium Gr01-1014_33]